MGNPVLRAPYDGQNDGSHVFPLFIPTYLYEGPDHYPNHMSGAFYILPFPTLPCIYATAFHVRTSYGFKSSYNL